MRACPGGGSVAAQTFTPRTPTMRQKYFIDSHKAATGPFVLLLMAVYDQWHNPTAWIYLALHGTYGVLWVLKSHFFPDKTGNGPRLGGFALVAWGGLSLLLDRALAADVARRAGAALVPRPVRRRSTRSGSFCTLPPTCRSTCGCKLRPGELLKEGLWARVRNPNYFGELLIYLGFGAARHALAASPRCWRVRAASTGCPTCAKGRLARTLSRSSPQYKRRSKLFIPLIF